MKDLTGQRFGRLVAVKALPPAPGRRNYRWECRCDCGNTHVVAGGDLRSGRTSSCGCAGGIFKLDDLTGQRFGRLVVIERSTNTKSGHPRWLCACDCGQQTIVDAKSLRRGCTISCGCFRKEANHEKGNAVAAYLAQNELKEDTNLSLLTSKIYTSNKTGKKGVVFNARTGRYEARITIRKKTKYLGSYKKLDDAIKARERAEEELFEPMLNKYGRTLCDPEISEKG